MPDLRELWVQTSKDYDGPNPELYWWETAGRAYLRLQRHNAVLYVLLVACFFWAVWASVAAWRPR
jgi:hypothetical protein